jgi:putative sterol carrier protein
MSDATQDFFQRIDGREPDPRLGRVRGTVRFELADGDAVDTWTAVLDRGAVRVARDAERVDCVVRTERATFERMVGGELNPTVALLQGLVVAEGELDLLWYFQRLFRIGEPARPAAGVAGGRP